MQKTVLILGAGFSVPYKYPTGESLVQLIIEKYKNSGPQSSALKNLAIDLESTAAYSIDRFLSDKSVHYNAGIEAIVTELLLAEQESLNSTVNPHEDVIKLILKEMEEIDFDKLKIISFNYDRLLEWKLFKKFRTFCDNDLEAIEKLKKINIEHIHGRILPFNQNEAQIRGIDPAYEFSYGFSGISDSETKKQCKKIAIKFAQEKFKTIYTNDDVPNDFAVDAIKQAKRVFFLGFRFDEKNMHKLGIGAKGIRYDWASKYVAGTCLGMGKVELKKTFSEYPFLNDQLFNVNAKNFFTDHFSLTNHTYDAITLSIANRNCCQSSAIQDQPESSNKNSHNSSQYPEFIVCRECGKIHEVLYSRDLPRNLEWSAQIVREVPKAQYNFMKGPF